MAENIFNDINTQVRLGECVNAAISVKRPSIYSAFSVRIEQMHFSQKFLRDSS